MHTWSADGLYLQGDFVDLQNYPLFREVNYWIDGFLRGQSVPIYFFISGFVFFFGVEWNKATYLRKLKNRVKTLLIPYLIWNTIAILLTFLKLLPLFNEFQIFDADFQFSIQSLLGCFWDNSHGFFSARIDSQPANSAIYPSDPPLWFLRDLMLIVVCTPLLYRMLKRIGVHAVIGLGLLWFTMGYWDLGHANQLMNALFFFSWGAYLSIHRKDMLEIFGRYFKRSMWIYPLFALSYIIAMHGWPEAAFTIKRLNIVAGLLFAYKCSSLAAQSRHLSSNYVSCSFELLHLCIARAYLLPIAPHTVRSDTAPIGHGHSGSVYNSYPIDPHATFERVLSDETLHAPTAENHSRTGMKPESRPFHRSGFVLKIRPRTKPYRNRTAKVATTKPPQKPTKICAPLWHPK